MKNGYVMASSESGVTKAYPFTVLPSMITTKEQDYDGLLLKGVEQAFIDDVLEEYLTAGKTPNISTEGGSQEIYLFLIRLLSE